MADPIGMTHDHPATTHAASPATRLARQAVSLPLPQAAAPEVALTPPEWVHLIPAGTFSGRDGRGPYTLDAAAVLDAFAANGADLPIDYDHQSLTAEDKAGPVPAAGWIKELSAREDGIWARVEWTPRAAELLANKEYRYLSPVFLYRAEDGAVVELTGAGLTHNPNLYLQAAASRKESHAVEELLERLVYLLNLPITATPDEVAAELQKLIDRLTTAETAAAQAAEQLAAAQARAPDPAEYVPVAMHRTVADQLAALQAEIARRDAEAAVTEAMAARKISPGLRDWALAYAARDLEGFKAFAAAAPEIVPSGETKPAAHAVAGVTLTEADRIAARLVGMTEEAFAKAKIQDI
jgi:phage I-like protein